MRLEVLHRRYREDHLAWVKHAHPEVRIVGGKDVAFSGKGPPDFVGALMGGRSVCFDAKETRDSTWSFGLLKDHQARDLGAVRRMGGLSFLFIWFRHVNPGVLGCVMWEDLEDRWWRWRESGGRPASIRFDDPAVVVCDGEGDWIRALGVGDDRIEGRPREVGAASAG
jgi:penicillin-binding protein-related factor A (putative recombinase)